MENINIGGLYLPVVKTFIVAFLAIHAAFSFMVSKQVILMTKTLEVGFEKIIKNIALLHFVASIVILISALVLL